jgi:S-layer family protein
MKQITLFAIIALIAVSGCTGKSSENTAASPTPMETATGATTAMGSASPASASASPMASPTTAASYTDLAGVFGADKILDLAHLGIFDTTSGAFKPNDVITRRIFLRWLFKANNAFWSGSDAKQLRPAISTDPSAFKDLSSSDPDFAYVQGLQNSGIAVGFPDKTARLDQPLTREQMLAVKSLLDKGAAPEAKPSDIGQLVYQLPAWKDKKQIAAAFVPAIENSTFADNKKIDNVGRVFGTIDILRPQQPVTRAQAAILLWQIGDHQPYSSGPDASRTAAQALAPPATP